MGIGISSSGGGYSKKAADAKFATKDYVVPKTGGTFDGNVNVAGVLSATQIYTLSANYLTTNFLLLTSLNVSGDVLVTGSVTAANLFPSNWNATYTNVSQNSGIWTTYQQNSASYATYNYVNNFTPLSTFTIVQTNSAFWSDITIFNTTSNNNYTIQSSDRNKLIAVNSSSNGVVIVPNDATYNFDTGTQINICRLGTGTVTISAESPVGLKSADSQVSLRVRYSTATILKLGSNDWLLFGDLS